MAHRIALVAGAGAAVALWVIRWRRRAVAPPRAAVDLPLAADDGARVVESMHVYPIKSCAGQQVSSAAVDEWGLVGDRRFMVYRDAAGEARFLTQRQQPRMALLDVDVADAADCLQLTLSWRGAPGWREAWGAWPLAPPRSIVFLVPKDARDLASVRVGIWSDTPCAYAVGGKDIEGWLSWWLRTRGARLCWTGPRFERDVNTRYVPHAVQRPGGKPAQVAFGDGYPLLLVGTASLAELNRRLRSAGEHAVPADRFRANVVVRTREPFEEDTWKRVRIGEVEFAGVKGCGRCKIPTVDQLSGERASARPGTTGAGAGLPEPLATLATFRKFGDNYYFGQNLVPFACTGSISTGERVVVLETGDPRWDEEVVPRE